MQLLYACPHCCTYCCGLAAWAGVDVSHWAACERLTNRRRRRGGARMRALRPAATRLAVKRSADFGKNSLQFGAYLGLGPMPVAHLAVERPRRAVQPSSLNVLFCGRDLPNVRRKASVHVMNAQLASDALLDDVANLRIECHDRLKWANHNT